MVELQESRELPINKMKILGSGFIYRILFYVIALGTFLELFFYGSISHNDIAIN